MTTPNYPSANLSSTQATLTTAIKHLETITARITEFSAKGIDVTYLVAEQAKSAAAVTEARAACALLLSPSYTGCQIYASPAQLAEAGLRATASSSAPTKSTKSLAEQCAEASAAAKPFTSKMNCQIFSVPEGCNIPALVAEHVNAQIQQQEVVAKLEVNPPTPSRMNCQILSAPTVPTPPAAITPSQVQARKALWSQAKAQNS